MTFALKAIPFYFSLKVPRNPPGEIGVMNPYEDEITRKLTAEFFNKFYNDDRPRSFIFGINPGRFGGGTTGIGFTDPVALRNFCGIENELGNKRELSSEFVYMVINEYGGAKKFYSDFFISAIYPLALIKDGKNYNYYDDRQVFEKLKNEIISLMKTQIGFGANKKKVISFGKKNADYLKIINDELKFFREIITLDHPRFIMQYRRKKMEEYIEKYLKTLRSVL